MKILIKLILCVAIIAPSINISAQNILPYEWTISFDDVSSLDKRNAISPNNVNILLSWERQGFFSGDGSCTLFATFGVDKPDEIYVLTSRLQCHIKSLIINGVEIGNNIDTQFWTDRNASTSIVLPPGLLYKGNNDITILCDNLSYTGGIGHNLITITPQDNKNAEEVDIKIAAKDHIFLDSKPAIMINYSAETKAQLNVKLEDDFHNRLLDTTIAVKPAIKGSLKLDLSNQASKPGFYQCIAMLQSKGYSGDVQWFAVNPEEVVCNNTIPQNFNEYWDSAKMSLAKIAPNFRTHRVDSLSSDKRDAYIVEMQSLGDLTIRGYYFTPKKAGSYYALLHVPGYGYGFDNLDMFRNSDVDRIDFALCVRGHGISADVFNPGFGIPGIWGYGLYERDSIAYRSIYMDCVRAIDFLCSRKEVDHNRIGVLGGSQGGGLALATAGLCSERVTACAYFDPFPCDIRHHINLRTLCQTELKNYLQYYENPCSFEDALLIQDLIDARNFAPNIKGKIHFSTALFDDDCPSHTGFSTYNLIHSDKTFTVYPHDSHLGESNYTEMFLKWFEQIFKENKQLRTVKAR